MGSSGDPAAHSRIETAFAARAAPGSVASLRSTHGALRGLLPTTQRMADRLVLLEEVPATEIRVGVDRLQRALEQHAERADPFLEALRGHRLPGRVPPELLQEEHRIFPGSVQQLRWFLDIVLGDDHGGNRQALGQFWKLLGESLHQHLEDEGAYLVAVGADRRVRPSPRAADGGRAGARSASDAGVAGRRTDR